MSQEMRKSFIGNILAGLIERTGDSKVMRAITKMVEDWIKNKVSPVVCRLCGEGDVCVCMYNMTCLAYTSV